MQLIAARSDPSASHNCFAFKTGQHYRSSDDGEPGGTAGRPILGVIEGEGLDGVAVLVTRYYGGIKLGTGGLVRAYSAAARAVLQAAPRVEITPRVLVRVLVPFECLGAAHQAAEAAKARRVSEEYSARSGEGGTADGMELVLEIDADGVHGLREAMREGSAGRIEVEVVGGKGDGV